MVQQGIYILIASIPVMTDKVEKEGFGHLDFVFGLGADTYVNTPIIEKMNELIRWSSFKDQVRSQILAIIKTSYILDLRAIVK